MGTKVPEVCGSIIDVPLVLVNDLHVTTKLLEL